MFVTDRMAGLRRAQDDGVWSPEGEFPRRRWVKPHLGLLKTMLRGSNRPVFWSGGFSMPCVTHLGLHKGPAGLRAADSTVAAALRGKACRRACVCAVPGSDAGPGGFVCVCGVNTNPDKGRAGLGCSAVGLPWRIPRHVRQRDVGGRCSGCKGTLWASIPSTKE